MFCPLVCMCTVYVPGAFKPQNKASNPLKQELWMAVIYSRYY